MTAGGPASTTPALPALVSTQPHVGTFWASTTPARWTDLQFQDIRGQGLIVIGLADAAESDEVASLVTLEDILIARARRKQR